MQVEWHKFLKKIIPDTIPPTTDITICPFHPEYIPTMKICQATSKEPVYFMCTYNRCRFYGDAVSLVCRLMNLDYITAANMFLPGNFLNSTLVNPKTATQQVKTYLKTKFVEPYISNCCYKITTNTGLYLRYKLIDKNILSRNINDFSNIPFNIGIYLPTPQFKCKKVKLQDSNNCIVYRYSYKFQCTAVKIHSLCENKSEFIFKDSKKPNIFYDELITNKTDTIFLCFNELDAIKLNTKLHTWYLHSPIAICTTRLPLPSKYKHISKIIIPKFKDTNIKLSTLLSLLSYNKYITSGKVYNLNILDMYHTLDEFSGEIRYRPYILTTWLLKQLYELLIKDTQLLNKTLKQAKLSQRGWWKLLRSAKKDKIIRLYPALRQIYEHTVKIEK